jgi:hypothetical protein
MMDTTLEIRPYDVGDLPQSEVLVDCVDLADAAPLEAAAPTEIEEAIILDGHRDAVAKTDMDTAGASAGENSNATKEGPWVLVWGLGPYETQVLYEHKPARENNITVPPLLLSMIPHGLSTDPSFDGAFGHEANSTPVVLTHDQLRDYFVCKDPGALRSGRPGMPDNVRIGPVPPLSMSVADFQPIDMAGNTSAPVATVFPKPPTPHAETSWDRLRMGSDGAVDYVLASYGVKKPKKGLIGTAQRIKTRLAKNSSVIVGVGAGHIAHAGAAALISAFTTAALVTTMPAWATVATGVATVVATGAIASTARTMAVKLYKHAQGKEKLGQDWIRASFKKGFSAKGMLISGVFGGLGALAGVENELLAEYAGKAVDYVKDNLPTPVTQLWASANAFRRGLFSGEPTGNLLPSSSVPTEPLRDMGSSMPHFISDADLASTSALPPIEISLANPSADAWNPNAPSSLNTELSPTIEIPLDATPALEPLVTAGVSKEYNGFMQSETFARLPEPVQKQFAEAVALADPAEKAAAIRDAANTGVIEIKKMTFEKDFSHGFGPSNTKGMTAGLKAIADGLNLGKLAGLNPDKGTMWQLLRDGKYVAFRLGRLAVRPFVTATPS